MENVQVVKNINITIDKYVLHSSFYVVNINDVDIVLGYPWMDSVGTVNINVKKLFFEYLVQ